MSFSSFSFERRWGETGHPAREARCLLARQVLLGPEQNRRGERVGHLAASAVD
jgi:hypothetical protein